MTITTKTNFSTHPWDDVTVKPLVCGLCGLDATSTPRDKVPPCKTRVVNNGTFRYDIYIGRSEIWGNPFVEGKDGTRDEIIAKHAAWILTQPQLLAKLPEIAGRILGCWCKPKACHGDVLARLADGLNCRHAIDLDACVRCGLDLEAIKALVDANENTAHRDLKPDNVILPEESPVQDDYDPTVIIIDTETTGTDRGKDQIIELAIQFGFGTPDGGPAPQRVWRFKPDVPIHPGASKVHGITAETLANEPSFRIHAQRILEMIEAAEVIIGYNLPFDLDMIFAELARCGLPMPDLRGKAIVDALRLWHTFESRTLVAAHERFVGEAFDGAHGAGADIAATARVTLAMCDRFGLLAEGLTWQEIANKADPERLTWLGHTNHFKWVDGAVVITFGKHKDEKVHEISGQGGKGYGYLKWMQGSDFPAHVKQIGLAAMKLRGGKAFLDWATKNFPPPAGGGETPPEA